MIAQELALHYPRQIDRLILGCTNCGGPHAILAPMHVLETLLVPPDMPREEAIRRQWPVMFSPDFVKHNPDVLDRLTARSLEHPTPLYSAMRQAVDVQRFKTYGRLGQIVAPTLVVAGSADQITPYENSGSRLRRDDLESVVYSTGLNSNTSLVTPKRTDRDGILGQKPSGFQLFLPGCQTEHS